MGLINVQEATERVLSEIGPVGVTERPLREALGLFLAEEIRAGESLPPFDNSAMDGYAARSADLSGAGKEAPARLEILGESVAGLGWEGALKSGEAVQIMTGAPVPAGADTVVVLEEARRREGTVIVDHPVPAGRHIRRRGEDVEAGRVVLPAGRKIRPAEAALLASLGVGKVKVFRPPRVAVLATGSELLAPGEPGRPGSIRDSNSVTLEAYLKPLGVEVVPLGIVRDEEEAVLGAFRAAADCDVILSSGGVSVGEKDLVKRILIKEFAFRTLFWRVAMKPGKPMLFGKLGEKPLFGLPGNPVSCAVCFILFIGPALRRMMGDPDPFPVARKAVLSRDLAVKDADKTHFITARMERGDPPEVTPTTRQGSGMLSSMTEGNALIVVPAGTTSLARGASVEVILDE